MHTLMPIIAGIIIGIVFAIALHPPHNPEPTVIYINPKEAETGSAGAGGCIWFVLSILFVILMLAVLNQS